MRALKQSSCQEWKLTHPTGIHPEDILDFVYLDEFSDDWSAIFPHDEDEHALFALEILLTTDPTAGKVVKGTGGLRKIRFTNGDPDTGKSGGCRVCYAFFPDHHLVLMMMAYPKATKDNLSAVEKAGIKEYLQRTDKYLHQRALGRSDEQ